jgi:hypothetical protein
MVENTMNDLRQIVRETHNGYEYSEREFNNLATLVALCKDIIELYEDEFFIKESDEEGEF